jgi:uncharacterized repeat protein (TIGR01451 family)/fimbrial isopeptide formation D2 family protein
MGVRGLRLAGLRPLLTALTLAVTVLSPGMVGTTMAAPSSPLAVTKTADKNPVASGQTLMYTIAIRNTGGAAVGSVVMTDQVNGVGVIQTPPALPQLVITSSQGSCTQGGPNGNVVTCNIGTIAGGASVLITIGGQVTAANGTTLNNTASVTGTKSAQNFTTTASVSVQVSGGGGSSLPDLTINKTGPTTVATSSPMTYTLTVNNIGQANATGVKVVDTVPAGVTGISATGTSLFVCAVAAQTVTCQGGAVNQGQNATITITGTSPAIAGTITNTAVVDPDNTINEGAPGSPAELNNTSAVVNTTVGGTPPAPLLGIQKTDGYPAPSGSWWTGAGPDPVNPGQTLTYKIQVTNNATGNNSRADYVVVTDGTQGLEASSIVASQVIVNGTLGNGGGCTVTAPLVTCSIRSLNSGGTLTITISGTVISSAGGSIFNTATVTGNIKNTGVTNTASETTTVRPQVDLTITKADGPDPVCAASWPVDAPVSQHLPSTANGVAPPASGSPLALLGAPPCLGGLTYSLVVGNSGNGTATGVQVRDPLPPGLVFDSYQDVDGAGFVCSLLAGDVVDCTGGTIGAASIVHLNLLFAAPPTVVPITNTVTVDPNNAIFEADETNNTFTQTTQVGTGVDLAVWKSDSNPAVPPGSEPVLVPGSSSSLGDGYDPIATRGTQTYTIYVDDIGTQDVTGIRVRDTLPADTVFLSAVPDPAHGFTCSQSGGVVECVGGHLLGTMSEFYRPAGAPAGPPVDDLATIKIRVFARSTVGIMHNEVRVDPLNEIAEVNELNNLATDDTTVGTGDAGQGAYNQLAVVKTQTSPVGAVATNGTLIYDIQVDNKGTDPVSNVVVKDYLPTGARFIEAMDTAPGSAAFFCTHDGSATGGTITCTGGDLSGSINAIAGVPTSRHITVKVFAPNTPGTYTNHATVDPDNVVPEGNEFDNDASVATTVTVGGQNMFNELTITKTQTDPANGAVATSSIVTYHIDVTNAGSDPAFNVKVVDTLPTGFTFISAQDLSGPADPYRFNCVPGSGNTIVCAGATLSGNPNAAPGEPVSRTIEVKAFASSIPGSYTNTAVVDPDNAIPEGNETNNFAQAPTKVVVGAGFIDLTVGKSGPASVLPGATITYTLTVSNGGTDPAFNVTVRDDLPAHTTFVSAVDTTVENAGAFSCNLVSASVVCTGGTLDGSADLIPGPPDVPTTRTIEIKVLAPASISQFVADQSNISLDLFNRAFVDPGNAIAESNETNNASPNVKTTVSPAIDLVLDKQGPGSATQNQTTTYTITVTNTQVGDGALAQGVVIVDPLPVGLIPLNVEADPGNFACSLTENPVNSVTCVGDLNPGDTVTITISAFVTLENGTLDNEACVDPANTIAETNELNNCKHAISAVTPPAPDLQINKSADSGSVTAGQTLTYTLNVSNVGTGPTTAPVVVTDNVPADVTVVQVTPDGGWDCSATSGNNVSCTRPDMAAGDSANIVIQTTAGAGLTEPFQNTADVSGGGDTQGNNNQSSVTTLVGPAAIDLAVVSIQDDPDPVNPNGTLTYTSIVTNNGTSGTGPGAIVRVVLPAAGVPVPSMAVAADNGFSCSANTGLDASGKTFDCIGDFGASGSPTGSTTITAQMTVDSSAPPPAQLQVTVTADPGGVITESDETNNTKTEVTTISGTVCSGSPCVDLLATVTGTPVVASGGPAIYNVVVSNVGTATVPDSPAWSIDLEFIGLGVMTPVVAPAGVTCMPFGLGYRCTSASGAADAMDLAPGASVVFTVTVIVTAPPGGNGLFQVTADSTNVVSELTDGNNLAQFATVVSL